MHQVKADETKRRNGMTVKWTDAEHSFLVEEAHRRWTPVSVMVRDIVMETFGAEATEASAGGRE